MADALRSPQQLRIVIKLSRVEGAEKAKKIIDECLRSANLIDVRTADDTLRLSEAMIRHGGFAAVVGRAVKIEALLQGAAPHSH